jgi:hypothetical protein
LHCSVIQVHPTTITLPFITITLSTYTYVAVVNVAATASDISSHVCLPAEGILEYAYIGNVL